MNETDLLDKIRYLLFKYLERDIAEKTFSDFEKAMNSQRNVGKEVLHILSDKKRFHLDEDDRKELKEVAYHLGL